MSQVTTHQPDLTRDQLRAALAADLQGWEEHLAEHRAHGVTIEENTRCAREALANFVRIHYDKGVSSKDSGSVPQR